MQIDDRATRWILWGVVALLAMGAVVALLLWVIPPNAWF